MNIQHITAYLDGGTIVIQTNEGNFFIDKRIGTETPNALYNGYPGSSEAKIITDINIKRELIRELECQLMITMEPLKILKGKL
jgi:hypothetical protein